MPPPSQRSISAEEHAALRRGLPLHILDEVYAQGRRDFAAQCAPLQSPDRPLTRDEAAEWHALWEALLHLDRVFSGPLRDNDALKVRRDVMMDEAERRVKAKYREQANKNRSGRPSGVPPAIQARGSGSRGDVSTAGMKANNRGPRDAVADASRHSASDPKFSSNTGLPLERYAPADADSDAVVAHVREALRPLHSAMLARASAGSGGRSMASGAANKGKGGAAARLVDMDVDVDRSAAAGLPATGEPLRAHTAGEYVACLKGTGGTPRALKSGAGRGVKENAGASSDGHQRVSTKRAADADADAGEKSQAVKRAKLSQMQMPPVSPPARTTRSMAAAAVGSVIPAPVPGHSRAPRLATHKTARTYTPALEAYKAWIPTPAPSDGDADRVGVSVLTEDERAWLAAQGDLARAPDWWRPVRWLDLGARMYDYSQTCGGGAAGAGDVEGVRVLNVRPLHHGVLLRAWDLGEWRFAGVGHEGVGRAGVPWEEWIWGKKGRAWREGGRANA